MRSSFLALALLCLCVFAAQAKNYAVLVASSNGYENYRHQANVFHAYQVLVRNGVNAEDIIVIAYDDAVNHTNNPFKGQVYNAPTEKGGYDVYKGIKIDYKGEDVNPKTFLAVITGNSTAVGGRKVLKSTAEDNVFIYLCDHGAVGLVAFAHHIYLYADDLNKALNLMHSKNMYKKLVFYLEACESGSMFENVLPKNINVYATTSANATQPAKATYCEGDNIVHKKSMGTCLGSKYSVTFVEHMEIMNLTMTTLFDQYEYVKNRTTGSHVMKYGDLSIQKETADKYQSTPGKYQFVNYIAQIMNKTNSAKANIKEAAHNESSINSRDVRLAYLKAQNKLHPSLQNKLKIIQEIASQRRFELLFKRLHEKFALKTHVKTTHIDFPCLKKRMAFFTKTCGNFSDHGLKYVDYIHQTCAQNIKEKKYEMHVTQACLKFKFVDIGI